MSARIPGPLERTQAAWGEELPDWIEVLAQACAATSQRKVADLLSRSASLVSTVLSRSYRGDMALFEERVRGVLMSETVDCPALGKTARHVCQDWQVKSRDFSTINSARVQMFRACRRCPLNRVRYQEADAEPARAEEGT